MRRAPPAARRAASSAVSARPGHVTTRPRGTRSRKASAAMTASTPATRMPTARRVVRGSHMTIRRAQRRVARRSARAASARPARRARRPRAPAPVPPRRRSSGVVSRRPRSLQSGTGLPRCDASRLPPARGRPAAGTPDGQRGRAPRQAATPISRSSFCRTRSGSTTGLAR